MNQEILIRIEEKLDKILKILYKEEVVVVVNQYDTDSIVIELVEELGEKR